MLHLNSVQMIGGLVREPEIREVNGTKVAKVTLAVNTTRKTKEGYKEEVCFIDVVVWGNKAEGVANLRKGQQIFVNGRLKQDNWQDKTTGEKKSKYIIQADSFVHEGELGDQPILDETPVAKLYNAPDNKPPRDPFPKKQEQAGRTYKSAPVQNNEDYGDLPF